MRNLLLTLSLGTFIVCGCSTTPDPSTFAIGPKDVVAAKMTTEGDRATIEIRLTTRKAQELAKKTEARLGQRLPLVIGGKVVSEPVVRQVIVGPQVSITGQSRDDAAEILRALEVK
jgi:preprotein translocase subunit SecD